MILNDADIVRLIITNNMIDPCCSRTRVDPVNGAKVLSYGLGYFGYDVRLATNFKVVDRHKLVVDPKTVNKESYLSYEWHSNVVLEPQETVLASTIEYFRMPKDVCGICLGKSTYARCGLLVNATPLEPGWEGNLTLELTNLNKHNSIRLYVGEGIAQIIFFRGDEPSTSYTGNYQGSIGTMLPLV